MDALDFTELKCLARKQNLKLIFYLKPLKLSQTALKRNWELGWGAGRHRPIGGAMMGFGWAGSCGCGG